jgi:plastocyanin
MAGRRRGTTLGSVKALGLVAALSVAVIAPATAAAAPQRTITITHVMRGCHAWDLGHGPMRATMSITVKRGTAVQFVNNDVMPHKLVRMAGPKLAIKGANMNKMAAKAGATFRHPGVYRFKTVYGAFFPWARSMAAEITWMNSLHLTIRVQ